VAYATAARSIQYTSKQALNPLQKALVSEYATALARGTEAELLLLRPLVEGGDRDALSDALREAKYPPTLSQFLEQWHAMSPDGVETDPDRATAYFDRLLNLERDALRLGLKETFLLFQDAAWRELQERHYWLAQVNEELAPGEPVVVERSLLSADHARLRVQTPLPSVDGLPPQSLGDIVYLRNQDGGWRHASVLDGYSWTFVDIPTPTATPEPTATPAAGRGSD
jgi:hypothetical protein